MITVRKYVLMRDVTQEECHWLSGTVYKGTVVEKFIGATYGCITGTGLAVTFDGGVTFCELPASALSEVVSGDG